MAQTWYLNDTLNLLSAGTTFEANFVMDDGSPCKGISFILTGANYNTMIYQSRYGSETYIAYIGNTDLGWQGSRYRKITFETAPTGELLIWLQANATIVTTDYLTTDVDLAKVADAIRAKTGSTDALVFPDGFVTAINNIPSGAYNITTTDNADGSQNLAIVDV